MTQEDRRVRKTKAALRTAIVELVLEKGYEAVTGEDIAALADVTRATFYKHYTNKEHLLADVVDSFTTGVGDAFRQDDDGQGRLRLAILLDHARQTSDVARMIVRGEGDGVALRRFTETIEGVLLENLRTGFLDPEVDDADVALLVKLRSAQIIAGVAWFIDHGRDPDETAATIQRLMDFGAKRVPLTP